MLKLYAVMMMNYECLTTITPGLSCWGCIWYWSWIPWACWFIYDDGLGLRDWPGRNSKLIGCSSSSELLAIRLRTWCFREVTVVETGTPVCTVVGNPADADISAGAVDVRANGASIKSRDWTCDGLLLLDEHISMALGGEHDLDVDDWPPPLLFRSSENRWSPSRWRIASTIVSKLFRIVKHLKY